MITRPLTLKAIILSYYRTLSLILIISSTNWFILWILIEINAIIIIPLLTYSNRPSTRAAVKYFIIQRISSIIILSIIITSCSSHLSHIPSLLILASLLLKIGIAPFHFWLPQVIIPLTWSTAFLLITWQKMAPLVIISSILHNWPLTLNVLILLNTLMGTIGRILQTQIRPLLAYLSVTHSAWLIAKMVTTNMPSHFFTYSTIILLIINIVRLTAALPAHISLTALLILAYAMKISSVLVTTWLFIKLSSIRVTNCMGLFGWVIITIWKALVIVIIIQSSFPYDKGWAPTSIISRTILLSPSGVQLKVVSKELFQEMKDDPEFYGSWKTLLDALEPHAPHQCEWYCKKAHNIALDYDTFLRIKALISECSKLANKSAVYLDIYNSNPYLYWWAPYQLSSNNHLLSQKLVKLSYELRLFDPPKTSWIYINPARFDFSSLSTPANSIITKLNLPVRQLNNIETPTHIITNLVQLAFSLP